MTSLRDFIAARLDEDQEAAENASQDPDEGNVWTVGARRREFKQEARIGDDRDDLVFDIKDGVCVAFDELLEYLTRFHPRRILREIESKRAIVEEHSGTHSCGADHATDEDPCDTLKFMAAVYSDHPSYREEWAA